MRRLICLSCGWYIDEGAAGKHCKDAVMWDMKGEKQEIEEETKKILEEIETNGKCLRY